MEHSIISKCLTKLKMFSVMTHLPSTLHCFSLEVIVFSQLISLILSQGVILTLNITCFVSRLKWLALNNGARRYNSHICLVFKKMREKRNFTKDGLNTLCVRQKLTSLECNTVNEETRTNTLKERKRVKTRKIIMLKRFYVAWYVYVMGQI